MHICKGIRAIAAALIVLLIAASASWAALTIGDNKPVTDGNSRTRIMTVDFDSSYASGGEAFDTSTLGMKSVDQVRIYPQDGYVFEYDYTNKKIKVKAAAPAVVYEEAKTVTQSDSIYSITLDYPAAFIMNVATSDTSILPVYSTGTTAESAKYAFNLVADIPTTLYFNVAQNNTAVYVTYATQAWRELWSNVVVGEVDDVSGNVTNLSYNAIAIMAVKADNATAGYQANSTLFLDKDDTAAAGECAVDFTPSAGNTQLTFAGASAVDSATVTYVKKPSAGFLLNNWVEEETAILEAGNQTTAYPVLLWAYANQVPINTKTTQTLIKEATTNASLATDQAFFWNWHRGAPGDASRIATNEQTAMTTATYVKGFASEVQTVPLEVPNGTDLSGITGVRVEIIGR